MFFIVVFLVVIIIWDCIYEFFIDLLIIKKYYLHNLFLINYEKYEKRKEKIDFILYEGKILNILNYSYSMKCLIKKNINNLKIEFFLETRYFDHIFFNYSL